MSSLKLKVRAGVASAVSVGLLTVTAGTLPAAAQTPQLAPTARVTQSATVNADAVHANAYFAAARARATRATTVNLNFRAGASLRARVLTVIRKGRVVQLVGPRRNGFSYIMYAGRYGWAATRYLGPVRRPAAKAPVRVSSKSYPSTERRLTARTIRVHRALRAAFPQIRTVYGYRPGTAGEHRLGRALDVMLPGNYRSASSRALGKRIADWSRSKSGSLGVMYVIWDQRIWNSQRSGDGWRLMRNGGSDSANHKNHVHISVR